MGTALNFIQKKRQIEKRTRKQDYKPNQMESKD